MTVPAKLCGFFVRAAIIEQTPDPAASAVNGGLRPPNCRHIAFCFPSGFR